VAVGGQPVPLLGVRVEAEIKDYGARVVVFQRYRNDETQPIEAVYKFPLDEAAAVCGFEATIDDRHVVGQVEEREKAFEKYDDAMAAGHGAYLLDQERPDIFTVSVGNVPPGKEVVLRITTVSELGLEGDAIRFVLPTTISPRYAPAEDRRGVGIPPADLVTPPYALAVPYGLNLKVDVLTSAAIRKVHSPSHTVQVTFEDRHATVELSSSSTAMDRDFVLLATPAEENEPRVLAERGQDGKAYVLVSFRPKLDAGFAASEVVFLVDRSGSMQGASILEARKALELALRSLRPGCFFNIVGFGNTHSALFPESRPFGDQTLASALSYVRSMDGDMGGTEIFPALKFVLDAKAQEGLPRQVFVITDGEVSNTDAVIELVRHHGARTRVFAFGIGAAPSHHLVKALARAGEGEAEFIAPGERADEKVLRQLGRALAAALTEVRVDWDGLSVEQAPYVVPPVFADGRVVVFGRVDELRAADVTLRASSSRGEVAFTVSLDPSAVPSGSLVPTLWARRAIRDLEEGCSRLHAPRGSRQERATAGLEERVKAEIIRLGTTYALMSRHTSFVAVEKRETPVQGEIQLRKIPVAISTGWHGTVAMPRYSMGGMGAMGTLAAQADGAVWARRMPVPTMADRLKSRAAGLFLSRETPPSAMLDRVVALQAADGSWDLTEAFAGAVGLSRRKLERAFGPVEEEIHRRRKALEQAAHLTHAALGSISSLPGQLGELGRLVRTGLRELGFPVDPTTADLAAGCEAVDDSIRRVRWTLDQLLQSLERFERDALREERLRSAFATALAFRWLHVRAADSRPEWEGLAQKAYAWLDKAPLGADFWLEAVDRSKLLA
jgi:Ca-activated chloride channel family protein